MSPELSYECHKYLATYHHARAATHSSAGDTECALQGLDAKKKLRFKKKPATADDAEGEPRPVIDLDEGEREPRTPRFPVLITAASIPQSETLIKFGGGDFLRTFSAGHSAFC